MPSSDPAEITAISLMIDMLNEAADNLERRSTIVRTAVHCLGEMMQKLQEEQLSSALLSIKTVREQLKLLEDDLENSL